MSADWFGPRLQELRTGKGWTQQKLADRAGVAVGAVRKLEQQGAKPTWGTVVALCEALGVKADAFLQEPAQRPPRRPGRPRKAAEGEAERGSARGETDAADFSPCYL
jgi:transcriptional regulator with XRE-family HTH domain